MEKLLKESEADKLVYPDSHARNVVYGPQNHICDMRTDN